MRTLRSFALSILLLTGSAFAQQLVTVSCDANSSATVTYTDSSGGNVTLTRNDRNGNGVIEFTVPDGVTQVTVGKHSDGTWLVYKVNLGN